MCAIRRVAGPLGHIQGSRLIPVQELAGRIAELEGFQENEVIAVCRTGSRSLKAASILTQAGFTRVASMKGGMVQWNANGYPIAAGGAEEA
jgi:rhodanese-related sulfurtransferase